MRRAHLYEMLLSLIVIAAGGSLLASEADQFRERADALEHKSAIAAKEGLEEEAEQMRREAEKLRHAAALWEKQTQGAKNSDDPSVAMKEAKQLKQELAKLRAQEKALYKSAPEAEFHKHHLKTIAVEQKLKQVLAQVNDKTVRTDPDRAHAKLEHAQRRIHHLRVAAENLKLADMPELAGQVAEKAEAAEHELRETAERMATRNHEFQEKRGEVNSDQIRDLHEAIKQLRAEVKELRERIDDDD